MLRDKRVILKEMMEDSKLPSKTINYDKSTYPSLPLEKVRNGLYKLNGESTQKQSVWGTNLITNGDFSNGTTGWSSYNGAISVNNNILSLVGSGSSPYPVIKQLITDTPLAHSWYVAFRVRATNDAITKIELSLSEYQDGTYVRNNPFTVVTNPVQNQWYDCFTELSSSLNYDYNNLNFAITSYYPDASTANGKIIEAQYFLMLDLTEIFGSGNEPTTVQIDTMLSIYPNNWFDGKGKLTDDIVTYIANSPSSTYPSDIINTTTTKTYSWTCPDNSALYDIVLSDDLRSISATEGQYDILWVNTFKNTCWIEKHIDETLLTNTSVLSTQTNVLISPTPIKLDFQVQNSDYNDEIISVEHSANAPIEVEVLGKTEQVVTVQGKNLFDKSIEPTFFNEYAVFTELDNGFKVSKSAIGQWSCVRIPVIEDVSAFAGQALILSFDAVVVNGTLSAFNVYLMIDTNDTTDRITLKSMTSSINNISSNYKLQFTLPSDLGNTKMLVFQPYADTSQNTEDGYTEYTNVQLELGSTATTYEPFVPDSPSPDYPSEIHKVLSGTSIDVVGRNLWLLVDYYYAHTGVGDTSGAGGSYTLPINFHGTFTLSANITRYEDDVAVNPRLTMVIYYEDGSYNAFTGFSNNIPADGLEHLIYVTGSSDTAKTIDHISGWLFNYSSYTFRHIEASNIQLELSSTATTYQPYQSGGSALSEHDLYEGDNWNVVNGEYTFDKAKLVLDGTENWTLYKSAENYNCYTCYLNEYSKYFNWSEVGNAFSTHFVISSFANTGYFVSAMTSAKFALMSNNGIGNKLAVCVTQQAVDEWKSFLAAQYAAGTPVTIVYQRAELLTVQGTTNLIKSVPRHTNIYSIPALGGLVPGLNVKTKIIGI